ncbi:M1 family metallopeptidase [Terrimonas sp. NA20]|uniref:M1 family metallopeptidase n=1 Tax=Terrimonas ginsenosidimutans TaxID=2908004 RepID=A0ABS9KYZ9_9BACT|nr:M1 family metallopeptidase [Terrimonas ginsenosidimutans]MCG2617571.1 M1 family metallopeptidase [Terrimonas ginsenosidimutans]
MMHIRFLLAALSLGSLVTAQSLPTPRNIQATYTKGTRSETGRPGNNYWQNTADYKLNIHFDPATRLLNGVVDIAYYNNSPDTLKQIWLKLYPNVYKKGSPRSFAVSPNDESEGVSIDSLWIDGAVTPANRIGISATNGILSRQALASKKKINIRIAYHYTLNKGSHNRTGEIEPNAAFVAYFFPRIAVYDDIDGWNTYPYIGAQEFYNDFCNFSAAITVPVNFVVWATGDLKNVTEVLSPEYADRLAAAERSDAITTIIDTTELSKKNFTPPGKAFNTWKFEATEVTDFAFATSDHYVWKSTSLVVDPSTKRRTRVDAVFNPRHKDYFHVVNDARATVESMSYRFPAWPFPYPHITVVDGLDQMEYPMMVNDNPVEDRTESITLTDHEIFHTMFPFYMGINETKYAWMDEGWATIGEWLISPMIDSSIVDEYGVQPYASSAGRETDLPIMTLTTEVNRSAFTNSYPKPAMGYLYVKDMLGDSLFTKALHHYIAQWHGKHPMPNDFFYSMNEGAGKNMNWFWKKWFFENGIPDLAIGKVNKKGKAYTVIVESKGAKPVPVDLVVTYSDGSTTKLHKSIAVWENSNKVTLTFDALKTVSRIELKHPHTPDSNPRDNIYTERD